MADTTSTASEGTDYSLTTVVADSITVASSNTTMTVLIKDCSDCTCEEGIKFVLYDGYCI